MTIHQAKTQFSRLMARAEGGEEILVKRGQIPVGRIVPLDSGDGARSARAVPAARFRALMERLPRGAEDDGAAEAALEMRQAEGSLEDPWES